MNKFNILNYNKQNNIVLVFLHHYSINMQYKKPKILTFMETSMHLCYQQPLLVPLTFERNGSWWV